MTANEDRPEMLSDGGMIDRAIGLVHQKYPSLPVEDVYVVWFCKTLGNWKALVSTNVRDDTYYEVTHNGAKNETYIDTYVKQGNEKVEGKS
jgi:hypothetical protein